MRLAAAVAGVLHSQTTPDAVTEGTPAQLDAALRSTKHLGRLLTRAVPRLRLISLAIPCENRLASDGRNLPSQSQKLQTHGRLVLDPRKTAHYSLGNRPLFLHACSRHRQDRPDLDHTQRPPGIKPDTRDACQPLPARLTHNPRDSGRPATFLQSRGSHGPLFSSPPLVDSPLSGRSFSFFPFFAGTCSQASQLAGPEPRILFDDDFFPLYYSLRFRRPSHSFNHEAGEVLLDRALRKHGKRQEVQGNWIVGKEELSEPI
ncbi:hypothetical protein VTJ04DRAFT_926 [Mycothermus thermophilus]|uniref:uncharacterized protein n=1 Tax=Humicola insolens TaxID=85995 RepID=UPI0037446B9B